MWATLPDKCRPDLHPVKMTRTLVYAIGALIDLAQADMDEVVSCNVLATKRGIPKRFLLQIMRQMVRAGVLRSVRGMDGGYCLNRPPERITFLDIVQAIEKPFSASTLSNRGFSKSTSQLLVATINKAINAQHRQFSRLNLAELVQTELLGAIDNTVCAPHFATRPSNGDELNAERIPNER
jgi:Rrf2 family protein